MHFSEILIDNRIPCTFIDEEGAKNIIYSRPLEESLDNVTTIITKDKEFIHNVITESFGETFLVTTVKLSDGEVFENVKFKLVVCEDEELPYSTIDTSAFDLPSDFHEVSTPTLIHESVSVGSKTTEEHIDYSKHLKQYINKIIKSKAL